MKKFNINLEIEVVDYNPPTSYQPLPIWGIKIGQTTGYLMSNELGHVSLYDTNFALVQTNVILDCDLPRK